MSVLPGQLALPDSQALRTDKQSDKPLPNVTQAYPSMIPSLPTTPEHPWPTGHIFQSPGAHLTYRVVGPCCRLFDRDQLPWPCCRIQWRGKEPSWRRIGKRLIPDMATRKSPSYCVEIVGQGYRTQPFVTTLYTAQFDPATQNWWYTKAAHLEASSSSSSP